MSGDAALIELLHYLRLHNYRFTAVTPATHARVLARGCARSPDHRDIFGWNRPFTKEDLEPPVLQLLEVADAVEVKGPDHLRSRIRVATLGADLFLHSAFPTDQVDAVFFGPDTYRFVRFVRQQLPRLSQIRHVGDMGAGTGAGAVAIARLAPSATLTLIDVNSNALRYAEVNAAAAGLDVKLVQSDKVPNGCDLLIANPPYMMDARARSYRDGGKLFGGALALDWVRQGLARLRPSGTFLLYTGAAYVDGRSPFLIALEGECRKARAQMCVEEIDPDVFGEELAEPNYREVERIAAVGIKMTR